jgi:hypothetical protein
MQRVQILLRNLPPMLADILRETLCRLPDMEVVTATGSAGSFLDVLDPQRPCVIVQGLDNTIDVEELRGQLGASVPSRRVIGIEPDGRRGVVYELLPRSVEVGELALDLVVELIRGRTLDLRA